MLCQLVLAVILTILRFFLSIATAETILGVIESDADLISVCDYAIQRARADGLCSEPVTLLNATGCKGKYTEGTANAAQMFFENDIAGIVSSRCADETLEISRLSYFAKVPVFNRIGTSVSLFNNEQNPTIVDMAMTTVMGYVMAIQLVMQEYNVSTVGLCILLFCMMWLNVQCKNFKKRKHNRLNFTFIHKSDRSCGQCDSDARFPDRRAKIKRAKKIANDKTAKSKTAKDKTAKNASACTHRYL
ncbi:hypothetical protein L596_024794 [Steinernema carpocapsae]|uniref:Receptor ligand binding region domain-containing protein n=1 Tax=Steinernema carpocapsae TaxID=34508 RepID=A0A4U5M5S8_STECR|nr:hypothetical protein L596_024794 [Steinernema carpocapsae]